MVVCISGTMNFNNLLCTILILNEMYVYSLIHIGYIVHNRFSHSIQDIISNIGSHYILGSDKYRLIDYAMAWFFEQLGIQYLRIKMSHHHVLNLLMKKCCIQFKTSTKHDTVHNRYCMSVPLFTFVGGQTVLEL